MAKRLFNAEKVTQACVNYLERRKKRIEKEMDQLVEYRLYKRKKYFWLKDLTHEEMLCILKEEGAFGDYWQVVNSGVYYADLVERILDVACTVHGQEYVELSEEDIRLIGGDLDKIE
jgi:hypothetical protein